MERSYQKDRVNKRCEERGEEYRKMLMESLVRETADEYVFDTEHASYKSLVDKYVNPPSVPTIKQVKTFAKALFTGKKVSLEVMQKRLEICDTCKYQKINDKNEKWCGKCGCKTSANTRLLQNLAAYEENLPQWGCKHELGSRWKENGV